MKVWIEGETEVNGQRVAIEHRTTANLPTSRASQDFEVPATAAKKAAPAGVVP